MIKVIFIKSTPGVKIGQVKDVSDGYALNYLLPQGLAIKATPQKIQEYERLRNEIAASGDKQAERESLWLNNVSGQTIIFNAKATAEGRLYAGITRQAVTEAINNRWGTKITQDNIKMESAIKKIGDHSAQMSFSAGREVTFIIKVEPLHGQD